MAGEGKAGIVDDALVHRRGDDGAIAAVHAAGDGGVEQGEHVGAVAGIEHACGDRGRNRNVAHMQTALPVRGNGVAADEIGRDTEPGGARAQHPDIAQHREAAWQRLLRQRDAEIGPDSGGFAGGEGENGQIRGFAHPRDTRINRAGAVRRRPSRESAAPSPGRLLPPCVRGWPGAPAVSGVPA